ncbi:MAG: pyridoxal phosphate-dependent aminotransferase [Phycisphaerae bacterium]
MQLSRLAGSISPSVTLEINNKAAQMREAGEPVIHLGGGEPVSLAPESAVDAAIAKLQTRALRYGPADGDMALKREICKHTKQWYGIDVKPENVCISAGTKQSVMVCLQSLVDPGEEVILLAPYWVSYPEMVRICGGEPIVVQPQANLEPTLADIERAVTDKTKVIMINSPNNPSGVIYSDALLRGIVELCERRGIWLMSDDIYQQLDFDRDKPTTVMDFATKPFNENSIVLLNGVSKAYAMTGFRSGWAVTPPALRKAMSSLQGQQTSGPSIIGQVAAIGALSGPQDSVAKLCDHLRANRELLCAKLAGHPTIRFARPSGAFYCFPDFNAAERDSRKLANYLVETAKVVTVPGVDFGMDGHLRLSTCGGSEDLANGLERICWALDPDSPRETEIGGVRLRKS